METTDPLLSYLKDLREHPERFDSIRDIFEETKERIANKNGTHPGAIEGKKTNYPPPA